jgi:acyl-CoA thioester hydrolase
MDTINNYPKHYRYIVHWGDIDAAQHVNNLVYLRWSESARCSLFDEMFEGKFSFTKGIGPILAAQDAKYIFPMTLPDFALVGIKPIEILEDRFLLETRVFSEKHKRLACISKQTIVAYDYGILKKAPLPEDWVKALQRIL